jgi:membrane fusion protein (multidrug efflux system)
MAIVCIVAAVATLAVLLVSIAGSRVNRVKLSSQPKGVTVIEARAAQYSRTRHYVGTILPWIEVRIGPQIVSAYVSTVLVRPGDRVKRGQVLATLDCRSASASAKAVSMHARALQAQQAAIAHEAARFAELQTGGFASVNEIEKRTARSASKDAELMAAQVNIQRSALDVSDCILRAPFSGEIASRSIDPGAFVRPGVAIVRLIDRTTVRIVAEVPEADFDLALVGTVVHVHASATNRDLRATIARRSPGSVSSTRTVHLEVDVPDPDCSLPVGTTATLAVDVGMPSSATKIPLFAASVRESKATVFVVDGARARKGVHAVLGQHGGSLFLATTLAAGEHVVTQGLASLRDGDRIKAKLVELPKLEEQELGAADVAEAKP